ncbi:hypothetical protein QBC43DRAFT_328502 [Cladorrhinum sp. PSN259]|nr:hypothetical protein QBC43DRAFT_328502 [Cladorrhinum sp. PSN259]
MKASFFSVLASLAAFQTALALPAVASAGKAEGKLAPLPEGLPEGIYAGNLNEDGTTSWELIETVNSTAAPAVEKRQGNFGAHCDFSHTVNSNDRWQATMALANLCGSGRYYNSKSIAAFWGGAVAYGCNYQGAVGTTCYSSEIYDRLITVADNVCGGGQAGWFSYGQGTVSYGYTAANVGFC